MSNLELERISEEAAREFSTVERRKKKKEPQQEEEESAQAERDQLYASLLDRMFTELDKKQNAAKKISIPTPKTKIEAKKTYLANFKQISDAVERPMEHIQSFIMSELICETSIDNNQCLIMRAQFRPLQIERVIKSYINTYVRCAECNRFRTELKRDEVTRLLMMECKDCRSCKSVSTIQKNKI
jgi:translation initiation factor 2 subunit 2